MENNLSPIEDLEDKVFQLESWLRIAEQERDEYKANLDRFVQFSQKFDFQEVIKTVERRLDFSEKRFAAAEARIREDLAARFAVIIEPYLKETGRRVVSLSENQKTLEETLNNYEVKINDSLAAQNETLTGTIKTLTAQVVNTHNTGIAKWVNGYRQVEADLAQVNALAASLKQSTEQSAKSFVNATNAVGSLQKMIQHWEQDKAEDKQKWNALRENVEKSVDVVTTGMEKRNETFHRGLRRTTYFVSGFFCIGILFFAAFLYSSIDRTINEQIKIRAVEVEVLTKAQEAKIRDVLQTAVNNGADSQLTTRIKAEFCDTMLERMTGEQKGAYIEYINRRTQELKAVRKDRKVSYTVGGVTVH